MRFIHSLNLYQSSFVESCFSKACSWCYNFLHTDHYLVGNAKTICVRTADSAVWSSEAPICKLVTCKELSPPDHGSVSCDKEDSVGSICRFSCQSGYKLIGAATTKCGEYTSSKSIPSFSILDATFPWASKIATIDINLTQILSLHAPSCFRMIQIQTNSNQS